jgi:hypothetical protein
MPQCPRCRNNIGERVTRACYLCSRQQKVSVVLDVAYKLLTAGDDAKPITTYQIYQLRKDVDGLIAPYEEFSAFGHLQKV